MSKIFEEILAKRGVTEEFLRPKYSLERAKKLPDIEVAVARIKAAVNQDETVLVYGDYDVDGVTASTIMCEALKLAGVKRVEVMLPDRFIDGYGMSERCLERAVELKVGLVVTVDCGSNNAEVIKKLAEHKIDTIVTDHHELMNGVPERALAVVNPERYSEDEADLEKRELREICGAGVAFMVMQALVLEGLIPQNQEKWFLDLVLIGTICDSMVMNQINRELAYFGLIILQKTKRVGILELMRVAGVQKIDSEAIGFQIGPRLNAGGRMESAEISLKLLMSKERAEAAMLAEELNRLNGERRTAQRAALEEILVDSEPVIVAAGNWHEGVLGIIAGRLVEKYHRPAFVLGETEGIYKGSGRSFGDFNLAEAIKAVNETLIGGGGHAAACGVKLKKEDLMRFKEAVNQYYRSLNLTEQEKYLEVTEDIQVDNLAELDVDLYEEMSVLQPFGQGNAEPIFELLNTKIKFVETLGTEKKHLKFTLEKDGNLFKALVFNAREEWFNLDKDATYNVHINLVLNEWRGRKTVESRLLQIKKSDPSD
ncbi:single-stranded-DNA-specific exonuclease RecJ [Candidatus Saccharibacteria bacterium]|nr:single-stranded-DNA-specific exonuclease RecJ [Candidatus Saccharibacteria bacterium]